MAAPIRLAVLEDHRVVGTTLARALGAQPDIEIVGVATSLPAIRELLGRVRPDVILADADLGDHWALDLPRELGAGGPRVLFLSGHIKPAVIAAAADSGAAGYVSKAEPFEELVDAIRAVAEGRRWFAGIEPFDMWRKTSRGPTNREREVIALVVRGAANKEISAQLRIKERTVETHLRRLFDRYGLANRTELAVLALREGWVDGRG